jgi:hypothetical protein
MTKQQALTVVSDKVAAWVSATLITDLFDVEAEIKSDEDMERIADAMDIVEARLWNMGTRNA